MIFYQEKTDTKNFTSSLREMLCASPVKTVVTSLKTLRYLTKGVKCLLKGNLEVPVLDATAIGVSVIRRDFNTAGSIMFLLGIGEFLEEWTHKKSVGDLARSMSLNIGKVWMRRDGQEMLVSSNRILPGDEVIVHMGHIIPSTELLSLEKPW